MTPQQRKLLVTLLSDFSDDVPSNGFESDERAAFDAALAMLTDEADLQRRIGEAVLQAVPEATSEDFRARGGDMNRAIARVLREAGR